MDRGEELDELFDRYAQRLREAVGSSVALVTLLEPARQRFLGAAGPASPHEEGRETSLSQSFCEYVVSDSHPLVVADARRVPELADSLAVAALNVVAYAGWPITRTVASAAGDVPGKITSEILGVVCVIDHEPREWSSRDQLTLCDLATACAGELERYQV